MPERSGPLHCLIVLILVMPLFFSSGSVEIAIAGEAPSTQPAPEVQPVSAAPAKSEAPIPAIIPIKEDTAKVKNNVDEVQDRIEQGILGQVVRLDNFFSDLKSGDERKSGYQLQVRNFARVEKGGKLNIGILLRASASFPKMGDSLRLYISGDNEPEPLAPKLPEDPGNPGFDRPAQPAKVFNTELRYRFFQTPSTNIFLGAGFTLVIPPEAFVRSRLQHTRHISDITLVRFGETLFANNIVTFGETTEITLERALTPKTLLQWTSAGTVTYKDPGMEWGTELSLIRELSSKSAVTLTGGIYGNTGIDDVISNYRLLARYRRNFLKSWLFYELVPELSWPRQADGLFPANYGMTFILEVMFKGNSSERKDKPGDP